uniref:Uncharacterized protein n=1 Tax=Hyaloperonospora arabidopsidis (strain Emoy2) TaxID=559515 RepID=M4BNX1_HYAAE
MGCWDGLIFFPVYRLIYGSGWTIDNGGQAKRLLEERNDEQVSHLSLQITQLRQVGYRVVSTQKLCTANTYLTAWERNLTTRKDQWVARRSGLAS